MFGISASPLAIAYLGPFVVFMALMGANEIVGNFGNGLANWVWAEPKYWVFPLQTIACGGALAYWWRSYEFRWSRGILFGLAAGLLVLGIWISPQWLFGKPPRVDGFDPYFFGEGGAYWANLSVRFVRLVIVVPLLEEIFWRGFLLRHLIHDPFDQIPFGQPSWRANVIVAGAFAAAHWGPDAHVAFITGLIYNQVAFQTRSLGACVIAHSLTNLLLGIYVVQTKQWGFW